MNKFRIVSMPFLGICILSTYLFLETMIVPAYHFDQKGLLKAVLIITVSAFSGALFWLLGTPFEKRARTFRVLLTIATAVYGVCLIAVLFGSVDVTRKNAGIQSCSLVPFRTIRAYFRAYSDGTVNTSVVIENLLGNFLLFAPMGAVAPFFLDILRERRYFCAFTLLGLCMVEFLQFVTGRGSMDIDDVILNFAGAFLFHLLFWNKRAEAFWDKAGLIERRMGCPVA